MFNYRLWKIRYREKNIEFYLTLAMLGYRYMAADVAEVYFYN